MAYLKFLKSEKVYKAKVIPNGNIVTLKFDSEKEVSTAGFNLFLDEACEVDIGANFYHDFTTIYRNDDVIEEYNGYQLSNDGSVYVAPEPTPEPPEQTLEEIKEEKKSEIKSMSESDIVTGKKFSDHQFSYTSSDKMNIRNAYEDTLNSGNVALLKDSDGVSVELNQAQVASLYREQEKNRIEKESYAEQMIKMVDNSTTKDVVDRIVYGNELKGDYLVSYNEQVKKGIELLSNSISAMGAIKMQAQINAVSNTDEQALATKGLYKYWDNDAEGYHYSMSNPDDLRRNYGDGLWALQKEHDKQSNWYPGADPTLWRQIIEGHNGTYEDPIPVPDSVSTSGFEYEYGKYYSENGSVYLCQRQGVEDPESMYGQKETLYFPPSSLIGIYFVVV